MTLPVHVDGAQVMVLASIVERGKEVCHRTASAEFARRLGVRMLRLLRPLLETRGPIRGIDLSGNAIGPAGAKALGAALCGHTTVSRLVLR